MIRAALDTNVFVSAALSRTGAPAGVLLAWAHGEFDVVTCPAQLRELKRALSYTKLALYIEPGEATDLVEGVRRRAVVLSDPEDIPAISRDPEDDYVIALARAAGAHAIVSGDADLLALEDLQPPVVSPRAFLDRLDALS